MSLTTTAQRRPSALASTRRSSVVFPAPRKPLRTSTGSGAAGGAAASLASARSSGELSGAAAACACASVASASSRPCASDALPGSSARPAS